MCCRTILGGGLLSSQVQISATAYAAILDTWVFLLHIDWVNLKKKG